MTISQRPAPPDEMDGDEDDMEGVADIIRFTPEEWRARLKAELDELGLTYEELEEQARERMFDSSSAKKLWMFIDGTR